MRALLLGATAMVGFLAAACTTEGQQRTAAAQEGRQCFFPSQVTGYTEAGENQIYVHTGPRDVYLFETFGNCHDLKWSEAIGFDHRGTGTICSGLDVTLIVPTPIGPRRCPVRMIRKLNEAEAKSR